MSLNHEQKEQQLKEIWKELEEIRSSSILTRNFKQYALGFLFYRFISTDFTTKININKRLTGDLTYDYSMLKDYQISQSEQNRLTKEFGFFIKPSQLFCNVIKQLNNDNDFNQKLSDILREIKKSISFNNYLSSIFEYIDPNKDNLNYLGKNLKKQNKKLNEIFNFISEISVKSNNNSGVLEFHEIFNDWIHKYEKLDKETSGLYISKEAASLLIKLIADGVCFNSYEDKSIYDPSCGFGSVLIQSYKEWRNVIKNLKYSGETKLYNLACMNMRIHGIEHFDITNTNVLSDDYVSSDDDNNKFKFIVSRALSNWSGDRERTKEQERFKNLTDLPSNNKADLMFVMHCLHHLDDDGKASIICSTGSLSRSGREKEIRKYLINNNFIKTVIELPDKLVSGIKSNNSILILEKNNQEKNILFINATGLTQNSNEYDIESIMNSYNRRYDKKCEPWKLVPSNQIEENDYDLSANLYIRPNKNTKAKEDVSSINEEIALLEQELKNLVQHQCKVRNELDNNIYELNTKNSHSVSCENLTEKQNDSINNTPIVNLNNNRNYVTVGEICNIKRGNHKKSDKSGIYPIINCNNKILGYCNDYNADANTIMLVQRVNPGLISWRETKFWLNDSCWSIYAKAGQSFNNKFIYYALLNKQNEINSIISKGKAHPSINKEQFQNIEIPNISIDKQNQMVSLLDKLEELTQLLTKEYELRQKQYKFLSNKFLSNLNNNLNITSYKKLHEICNSWQGKYSIGNNDIHRNSGNYSVYSTSINETIGKIDKYDFSGEYIIWVPDKNDDNPIFGYKNESFSLTSNAGALKIKDNKKNEISYKYLLFVLNRFYKLKFHKNKYRIAWKDMKDWEIPIPNTIYQTTIVNKLDKIEQLCDSPEFGIKTELQKRQIQFKYYLKKLL